MAQAGPGRGSERSRRPGPAVFLYVRRGGASGCGLDADGGDAADAERELVGFQSESFDIDRLQAFARGYEEDVEFRMWENSAGARIMAAVESACNEYRSMGEDAYGDASNTGLVFECS